jgi:bifunctional aspartokinase / homoserine dehydrogenase 1
MIGVPGTAHRLFGALREEGISVILISQGSSEHSICFAVPEAEADAPSAWCAARSTRAARGPDPERRGQPRLQHPGGGRRRHGRRARRRGQGVRRAGAAGVNVRAIAQGASERNISVVIDGRGSARALRAGAFGFYLSAHTVSIGLIGPGLVGGALLDQIASQAQRLRATSSSTCACARSPARSACAGDGGHRPRRWRDEYAAGGEPARPRRFADHVHADHLPHAVIIDCTASAEVAKHYAHWLAPASTSSRRTRRPTAPRSASTERVQGRARAAGALPVRATVGAGLPVIQTLRDLRETGDEIRASRASSPARSPTCSTPGTAAVVLGGGAAGEGARLHRARSARRPVGHGRRAQADHPGREMGLKIEMATSRSRASCPARSPSCGVDEFLAALPEFDAPMLARSRRRARAATCCATSAGGRDGRREVGLVELPKRTRSPTSR